MPLKILPHGRLQEWVAEEQGYFAAEGLEYTFLPEGDYGVPVGQVSTGAFETFGAGRLADTIITVRRLIRESWTLYRWDGRPAKRP